MIGSKKKISLITGASRGLGAAISRSLAENNIHIIAVARTVGALEELDDQIKKIGGSATLVPFDITDESAIQRLCLSIFERWGGLDYWLHCAIYAPPLSPIAHIGNTDWDKSVEVNITATGRLITNIEPLLQMKSGTAVHMDDTRDGQKFFGTYAACKSAQRALFDAWASETATTKITVKTFLPKPMPTATRARFFPGEDRTKLSHPKREAARLLKLLNFT